MVVAEPASITPDDHDDAPMSLAQEWQRKRVHLLPGAIPFVMLLFYHDDPLPAWNLMLVAVCAGAWTWFVVRHPHARNAQDSWVGACIAYAITPMVVLVVFRENAEYVSAMLCILAFGDAAAALGGRMWGRRRLPWNHNKSWVGLLCFMGAALPTSVFVYYFEAKPKVLFIHVVWCAGSAVIVAAIAESLPMRLNDNLRIGIAAIATIVIMDHMLSV